MTLLVVTGSSVIAPQRGHT